MTQTRTTLLALALSLGISSLIKSRLAAHVLGARVSVWRWALPIAGAVAVLVGQIIIRLPEWAELAIGIPAILIAYGWVIWRKGFGPEDRVLFRKNLEGEDAAAPNRNNPRHVTKASRRGFWG